MAKMKRCYTCGYEERILSRVVYCVHCEETMVHRYCMDPPRHGDEEFDWVCEICCPRVYKQSKSPRTSEYLCSKLDSEAEKRNSRRKLKKPGYRSHDRQEDSKKSLGSSKGFVAEPGSLQAPEAEKRISRRKLKKPGYRSHDRQEDSKKSLARLKEFVAEPGSLQTPEAEKRNSRRKLKKPGYRSHDRQEDSKKSLGSLREFLAEPGSLQTPVDVYDDQPIGDEEVSAGFTSTRPVEEVRLHSASNKFVEMQCDLKAKESLPGTNKTTQREGSADLEQVSRACDRSRCSSQTSNGTRGGRGQSLKQDQGPKKCPPLQEPETDLRCKSSSPQSENLSSCLPSVSCLHKRSSSLIHNDINSHPTEEKRPVIGVNDGPAAHQPTLGVGRYQLIPRVGDGSHGSIESFLPISDVSWRGACRVTNKMHGLSIVELEAHLSNSANFKVSDAARTLPLLLDLELVDKLSEWPKRYSTEPPCGADIGLYFFPSRASDRKAYDDLLGRMIVDDLSLRLAGSDLRLLMFSSLELPKGTQRFNGKLYLWGAFSATLPLPSDEKVSIHHSLLSSHSKGGSCLEDLAGSRRSCRPTGGEVQSIGKGQGSSDAIQRSQQNAHFNDQRVSGRPSSSPLRPVGELETRHESTLPLQNSPHTPQPTWKNLKHAGIANQANGKRDGLQDPSVCSNPGTQIKGGKNSACAKKRKRGKAEFPDQGRKLDAPGNPADKSERIFSGSEMGDSKRQNKQNSGFFPGAKQKQKNKQKLKWKQKQKQWNSPYNKSPLGKAPKPGSRSQRSPNWRDEPPTPSSGAEHSVAMNGGIGPHQSPQSNPYPHQVPSSSHREMPVNKNWNEHSHPQQYAGFSGGQHPMPVAEQSHPQQYGGFSGGQHPNPVVWQSHPQQHGGFSGSQHPMPVGQSHPQQHAGFSGGQHPVPVVGQSHPQQHGGFSGGQHPTPVVGQSHPQQHGGFSGGQHPMPVVGQSHPQQYAGFSGGQHPTPVAKQSHPQQYAGFSGGQHTMPVAGHSHFQPYTGFPGGQRGLPMTWQWHPQPYASFPSGQQSMWQPHPRPHANFPGGQQALPVVGSEGDCP